jgi:hypothetical protein
LVGRQRKVETTVRWITDDRQPPGYIRIGKQPKEEVMDMYAILRRSAWGSADELGAAAGRSSAVGDEQMSEDIRWIRSYVLNELDGRVGTVCIYEASSPEAIREHASRADLAVDEIIPIADTVVIRPDPQGVRA